MRLKDPNKGEHVQYTLAELGMDPVQYSYGNRLQTYWEKDADGEYHFLAILPEKQVSKIEGLYYGVIGVGYFTILIGGISVFFIRRKRYRDGSRVSTIGWKSFIQSMLSGESTVLKRDMTR